MKKGCLHWQNFFLDFELYWRKEGEELRSSKKQQLACCHLKRDRKGKIYIQLCILHFFFSSFHAYDDMMQHLLPFVRPIRRNIGQTGDPKGWKFRSKLEPLGSVELVLWNIILPRKFWDFERMQKKSQKKLCFDFHIQRNMFAVNAQIFVWELYWVLWRVGV